MNPYIHVTNINQSTPKDMNKKVFGSSNGLIVASCKVNIKPESGIYFNIPLPASEISIDSLSIQTTVPEDTA